MADDAGQWTYVFSDLLTGAETGTFPMTGVSFDETLSGVGAASGVLPVFDPAIRAMDPWAATTPRRTMLHIELDDDVVWGGLVWSRKRATGKPGLTLTCATFESLLAYLFLRQDRAYNQTTAAAILTDLLAYLQSRPTPPGVANYTDFGIAVSQLGTGGMKRDRGYKAGDLRSALDLLGNFQATGTPIEFHIEVTKNDAGYKRTLLVGEPRLGRTLADTNREWSFPGELLGLEDFEDGTVQNNAAISAITPPGAAADAPKLLSSRTAGDVGSDAVGAGFPLLTKATSHSEVETQAGLDDAVTGDVLDALSRERTFSNVQVSATVPLTSYAVGDDLRVLVTDPNYREWPKAASFDMRITGRKVTVENGTQPRRIVLSVGGLNTGRLPASITLTAQLRSMFARLTTLETTKR